MRLCLLLLAAAAGAAPLAAQAPVITPAGDPSVRNDTLYALHADTATSDDGWLYLLDDGVVVLERDGRMRRTFRTVVQILTREAAEQWGEQTFAWSPSRERFTLNWIRVVAPDGRVLADGPSHDQESLAPVAQANPVYTDQRTRRVSIGAIAPGTILDYSYTTETIAPTLPGDALATWRITTGRPTRRSRYILDVPAGVRPRLVERNLRQPRTERRAGDRRVYTWAAADLAPVEPEHFAADSNDVVQSLEVALPLAWADIARWYAGLAAGRAELPAAVAEAFAPELAGARTLEDSLRAAHRWVAQDFRYVSLSLGIGGYRPRPPAEVLASRFGDCKDKATLFVALARSFGLRAWPVLVHSTGAADSTMPSISQFDHMIAAVETPAGRRYADLTADLVPYGEIPINVQGGFGLLVRDDGRGEPVRLPRDPAAANRVASTIEGELGPDGTFRGRYAKATTGSASYGMRNYFLEPWTPKQREEVQQALANAVVAGATADSLERFDGRDLTAPARFRFALSTPRLLSGQGTTRVLTLPLPSYANPALAQSLEKEVPTRRFPIDRGEVLGPAVNELTFRVTLPEGWRVDLPPDVRAASQFGTFEATYRQEGRVLTVRRRLEGTRGIAPPAAITELAAWVRAMSADDVPFVSVRLP